MKKPEGSIGFKYQDMLMRLLGASKHKGDTGPCGCIGPRGDEVLCPCMLQNYEATKKFLEEA